MSEAETPNNNSDSFESSPSQDVPHPEEPIRAEQNAAAAPGNQSEWITVNFPNAIRVDDIPRSPEPSQAGIRIQELEQQNHCLHSRVSELEAALTESQALLKRETKRLESAAQVQYAEAQQRANQERDRSQQQTALIAKQRQALDAARQRLEDQEGQIAEHTQALSAAQAQIAQLAQDLDLAQQAYQKQQILVETLTGQLQASQEQVAHLERDCALTKQRYDEQVQLVRQSENACRDLRSRLNRQQQYTLQFKAALEKCLDVPTPIAAIAEPTSEQPDLEIDPRVQAAQYVRAQPVQPWSATPEFPALPTEPEPAAVWLSESVTSEATENTNLVEAVEPEVIQPSVQMISELSELETLLSDVPESEMVWREPEFVSQAPLSYTIKRSENGSIEGSREIQLFKPEPVEPQIDALVLETENFIAEPLAAQAEILLQPEEPSEALAIQLNQNATPIETTASFPSIVNPWSEAGALLDAIEDSEEVQSQVPAASSPFITLTSDAVPTQPATEMEAPALSQDGGPSPIVYPTRSQKKIPSLAAVDLPSFPRSVN